MAKKSKTQRQKASIAKQNRKDRQEREAAAQNAAAATEGTAEEKKSSKLTRAEKKEQQQKQQSVKKTSKPKKVRFQFLHDVRAEMKRVTWPSRTDVMRWSGVVVGALLFFGVYVAVLDNFIVTPGLVFLTGLGA